MLKYIVKQVEQTAGDVLLLTLRPKVSNRRLSFWPGQYASIGFKRGGRPSPMRCFSIVSSPYEEDLQFAMRRQGMFTNAVARLSPGDEVLVQGPFGSFVLDADQDENIVMLAGGIGITPFISMLRYAAQKQLPIPITLLYSNKTVLDIPFADELMRLARANPRFRLRFLVDGETSRDSGMPVINSRLTPSLLRRLGDTSNVTFFICGPGGYMSSAEKALLEDDVYPGQIITESFAQGKKMSLAGGLATPQALTYIFSASVLAIGIFGIMVLDLARAVPKLASAQPKPSISNVATQTNVAPSPTATTTPSSAPSSTGATISPTAPQPTTSAPTYYYNPPMSSVS